MELDRGILRSGSCLDEFAMNRVHGSMEAKECLKAEDVSVQYNYFDREISASRFQLLRFGQIVHWHDAHVQKDFWSNPGQIDVVDVRGTNPTRVVIVALESLRRLQADFFIHCSSSAAKKSGALV